MEIMIALLKAFAVGGIICVIGQLIIDFTSITPARMLVGYVVAGVVLTGLGLYEPLVNFAECGATLPLTGFGYGMAKGVEKAVEADGAFGIITGPLSSAAGGISVAIIFGLLISFLAKPKEKK